MENGPAKTERTQRSRAEIVELIATYRQSGQKQRAQKILALCFSPSQPLLIFLVARYMKSKTSVAH